MKSKLELYHFLCLNEPIIINNKKNLSLIDNIEEVEEIYKKYPYESKQLFYLSKKKIHSLFYDNDYVFEFNKNDLKQVFQDKINLTELFFFQLLLSDESEIINYTYDCDYIQEINNNIFNPLVNLQNENSLQNFVGAKIILDLINNYLANDGKENQELKEIKEKNNEMIKVILIKNEILKELNYSFEDIIERPLDEIYSDIIVLLIKNNHLSNFDYSNKIIEELNLDSILITEVMFDRILQSLDEKNEYMKNYVINEHEDIIEEKINFYYILIKYILKNMTYIYNIPFLYNNYLNIIKWKFIDLDELDDNLKEKIIFLLDCFNDPYSNIRLSNNNHKIKSSQSLNSAFYNSDSELSSKSVKKLGSNIFDPEEQQNERVINNVENILKNCTIILAYDKDKDDSITYKIKEIKTSNESIDINEFDKALEFINKEKHKTLYDNYFLLVNFIKDILDYISQSEIYYTPDIKLELTREKETYDYYNDNNKNNDNIYNITCISSFIKDNDEELKFTDYNVLENGIESEHCGFLYLINELSNDDYKNSKTE